MPGPFKGVHKAIAAAQNKTGEKSTRSYMIAVENETDESLVLTEKNNWHGFWTNGCEPSITIAPRSCDWFLLESNGFMTGVQGNVIFNIGASNAFYAIEFCCPFVGSTTITHNLYGKPENGAAKAKYKCDFKPYSYHGGWGSSEGTGSNPRSTCRLTYK